MIRELSAERTEMELEQTWVIDVISCLEQSVMLLLAHHTLTLDVIIQIIILEIKSVSKQRKHTLP
jgi:hypothetical protein